MEETLHPPDMSPDMYETIMEYISISTGAGISSINSMMQSFHQLAISDASKTRVANRPTSSNGNHPETYPPGETKISHLSKRKITFKSAFKRRYVSSQEGSTGTLNQHKKNPPPKWILDSGQIIKNSRVVRSNFVNSKLNLVDLSGQLLQIPPTQNHPELTKPYGYVTGPYRPVRGPGTRRLRPSAMHMGVS